MSDRKHVSPPRSLPHGGRNDVHDVPGVGRFVMKYVGTGSHSEGTWVYLQREGAAEAERGYMPFSVRIHDEQGLQWIFNSSHLGLLSGPDLTFTPDEMRIAQELVEGIERRDEIRFKAQVHGAIYPETRRHEREIEDLQRRIAFSKRMLSGQVKTERSQESIEQDIARDERRLAQKLDLPEGSRLQRLFAVKETLSAWATEGREAGRPLREMIDEALSPETAAAPAP